MIVISLLPLIVLYFRWSDQLAQAEHALRSPKVPPQDVLKLERILTLDSALFRNHPPHAQPSRPISTLYRPTPHCLRDYAEFAPYHIRSRQSQTSKSTNSGHFCCKTHTKSSSNALYMRNILTLTRVFLSLKAMTLSLWSLTVCQSIGIFYPSNTHIHPQTPI